MPLHRSLALGEEATCGVHGLAAAAQGGQQRALAALRGGRLRGRPRPGGRVACSRRRADEQLGHVARCLPPLLPPPPPPPPPQRKPTTRAAVLAPPAPAVRSSPVAPCLAMPGCARLSLTWWSSASCAGLRWLGTSRLQSKCRRVALHTARRQACSLTACNQPPDHTFTLACV